MKTLNPMKSAGNRTAYFLERSLAPRPTPKANQKLIDSVVDQHPAAFVFECDGLAKA